MKEVVTYINDTLRKGQNVTAKMCAEHLGYDYHYFSKRFKKFFGATFLNYLTASKMELAVSYLVAGYKVSAAQEKLHYKSVSSFSREFKRHMGLSPLIFQERSLSFVELVAYYLSSEETLQLPYRQEAENHTGNRLEITLICSEDKPLRIFFAGLQKERLALGNPVMGIGLVNERHYVFENVPNGTYYLLTSAIGPEDEPSSILLPKLNYKDCTKTPLEFTGETEVHYQVNLRASTLTDPPAVINFPHLMETVEHADQN